MIKDLINIAPEEIKESANRSVENDNTKIMYLQNTGSNEHQWNCSDILCWINQDIDD